MQNEGWTAKQSRRKTLKVQPRAESRGDGSVGNTLATPVRRPDFECLGPM